MALPIRDALHSARRFATSNPFALAKIARHAMGLRMAVPLDALRWFVDNLPPNGKAPTDVTITADPPAITIGASIDLMGTALRANASIEVEELRVGPDEMRLQLKLSQVRLKLLEDSSSPVATLIKSGALDLSKPGNLANFMPKKPPMLVEARDDVVVLDLMQNKNIARNHRLRKVLSRITPVLNVSALRTEGDFLILAFRATPFGLPRVLTA